jgi:flagellar M-ring protein FliF
MDQIKKLFASLSKQQIIGIVAVVLLVGGGITSFVKWNHNRSFKALFTGMSPEDAAAIVQKLKESGVEHRISDNGTSVLVPDTKVDELRLEMAGAGLPKTGRIGFELFDRNNLGITDFTEHVNYRRALEGELERSVKALNIVEQARVHLTFPKDSVFLDYREPAKASVLVHTRVGTRLSPQNVTAIANLVASAVEGLTPELVSVLDMQGNLLSRPRKNSGEDGAPSEAALDYKHQIEKDLVAKVESTLEPLLGEGRFRVGVTADCDFTTSEQSEEIFDPTKSVMATSQKSEDVVGSGAQSAGVPGTSSNLPRAVPRAVTPGANSSRRTENTSFETSKTVRHLKVPQGSIKRISASLLLDQEVRWEGQGKNRKRVIVPPTPEQIKKINDIVAGVLGLDTQRGDRLVVESLPFEQTLLAEADTDPATKAAEKPKNGGIDLLHDKRLWIGSGVGLVALLAGGFFLLKRKRKAVKVQQAAALPQASEEVTAEVQDSVQLSAPVKEEAPAELDTEPLLQLPPMSKRIEALREHIKESVKKEPELAAEILRGWLAEQKK